MIAGGVLQTHLKDGTYSPPLIVGDFSSVGYALMLTLPMVGPKRKEWRFRGGPVRHTSSTSIKAAVRSIMKWNHDTVLEAWTRRTRRADGEGESLKSLWLRFWKVLCPYQCM